MAPPPTPPPPGWLRRRGGEPARGARTAGRAVHVAPVCQDAPLPAALELRRGIRARALAGLARHDAVGRGLASSLAATILVAAAASGDGREEAAILTFLVLTCASLAVPDRLCWARLMPLMGALPIGVGTLLGFGILAAASFETGSPDVGAGVLLMALLVQWPAAALYRALADRCLRGCRPVRLAVIGGSEPAEMLGRELRQARMTRYVLVARIAADHGRGSRAKGSVPCLGDLSDVETLVREHDIDLLLMSGEAGRMHVFEALGSCLHLPVRLIELSTFYEETFGHVPAAEINAAWFQYILHPSYSRPSAAAKRALDIAGALLIGMPFLIALGVLAVLIRRDGGPVFFWQLRVGEGGRPLRLCKLRTMRVGSAATWASADDPRVTGVGRFLRRTHLDELPQLLNVLRGEMSLVGPRPEQPHLVEQLERDVPFYSSRHLIRPGIAGWAQLRCGYAGSDVGSAWKLCHDLYYLKHRSLGFDLAILGETVRTLFIDSHSVPDPTATWFIVGRDRTGRQAVTAAAQHLPTA